MDNPGQIWHLIAKSLNGEASRFEREELDELLQQDESLQQRYDLLSRIWSETQSTSENLDSEGARNTISRIIVKADSGGLVKEITPLKTRISKRRVWLAAASLFIVATAGWLWTKSLATNQQIIKQEALEARKGSRIRSLLPDGTTVWLNAGSKLYYDKEFDGPTREVRLEGEAFFEVVKQTDRAFIVHTDGIDIKVLGTAFNVKSYPEDKTVETTLYHGSVQVFRNEDSDKKAIQLKPNEKLILSKEAAINSEDLSNEVKPLPVKALPHPGFTIAYIDSTKKESERFETAWLYSRLEFRGDNFEELARKLERWYNVTIIFNDEKVKKLNFNGSFEKETVPRAFAALKSAVPFNYNIKGQEIYVGSSE